MKQFQDFKSKTFAKMDRMESYYKFMMDAEAAVVLRNPIYEAEYIQEAM